MERRDFIQGLGRGALLAALVAVVGVLVSRRQVAGHQDCSDNFQCRSCNKLGACDLPEAENTRRDEKAG